MPISVVFETHSWSEDNDRGVASGWNHGRLSARGEVLARELGDRRRDDAIAAVFSSDLYRAAQTAAIAFEGSPIPVLHDWRLRECDYGDLNGTPSAQVHNAVSHLDERYPGGEHHLHRVPLERIRSVMDPPDGTAAALRDHRQVEPAADPARLSAGAPARSASRQRLRRANVAVGLVHLAQAALVLALSNGFAIAVTASFATGPPGTPPGEPSTLFEVAIGPAVATFLLLAALDHLLVAAPGVVGRYERGLAAGRNLFRWTEYSISASLMIVLIAMLTGITDVTALIAIFGVNAAMILFGWVVERTSAPGRRANWTAFGFGCIAGGVPWIAIAVALVGAETDGDVPGFVYGIFLSLFLFFNSFAVNMVLQYRRVGPWRSYRFGEAGYVGLSLAAKSALAWQVFAGTLAG